MGQGGKSTIECYENRGQGKHLKRGKPKAEGGRNNQAA
jgi:hypothetical protein